jgi:membrane protease YdiL (CAAX protease family)
MLSRIEVMACGGILLTLCLGGAVSGSGAAPADAAASPAGIDRLGLLLTAAMPLAVGLFVWRRWYDLGSAPRLSPVFSPSAGVAMFLVMLLLGMAGAEIVRRLLPDGSPSGELADLPLSQQAPVLLGHALGQAIVLAVFAWRVRRAAVWRRPGPARMALPRAVLVGAGAFLLAWPAVTAAALGAGLLARRISEEPVDTIAHDTLLLLVESPVGAWFLAMAGLVVLAVPLLEEVMYRGILQRTLVGVMGGRWRAILLTSAVFALMHVGAARWHAVPAVFVLSIGFGWVYEKTGRLWASVIMHILFNAVNLALALLSGPQA